MEIKIRSRTVGDYWQSRRVELQEAGMDSVSIETIYLEFMRGLSVIRFKEIGEKKDH